MNTEQRQEYNKNYYETKKDDIKKKLFTKVECPKCSRKISYQNVKKHQTSSYCIARCIGAGKIDSTTEIEKLKLKLTELEHRISNSEL